MALSIRQPAVAGSFYPEDQAELSSAIAGMLRGAKNFHIQPRCIIAPHAGYLFSGVVAATAYAQLKNLLVRPQSIILLGPSHYEMFAGAVFSSCSAWQTPLGTVAAVQPKPSHLISQLDAAHAPEHCLEVQLPFLQRTLKDFHIMPLLTGDVEPALLAKELIPYLSADALLVVSSDLSHYLPYATANQIDAFANDIIPTADVEKSEAIDACGKTAIATAMHIARALRWRGHFLEYKNSGDTSGSKDRVVGYGAYAYTER